MTYGPFVEIPYTFPTPSSITFSSMREELVPRTISQSTLVTNNVALGAIAVIGGQFIGSPFSIVAGFSFCILNCFILEDV